MSQRVRIQQYLIDLFIAGEFYPVEYDPQTFKPLPVDTSDENRIRPVSIYCNEVKSSFSLDSSQGTLVAEKRTSWEFYLVYRFAKEALLEEFEKSIMREVPKMPRIGDMPSALIFLVSHEPSHPITDHNNKGVRGTEGALVFNVSENRL